MDDVLTSMVVFWALMLLTYFLMQNGLSIFNDVAKSMGMFMLEKALGPGIDLVEGRPGSAPKAWIMQGLLWLLAASTLTFEGLWMMHDPLALHSLSAWGYSPTSGSLLYAGNYAVLYGGIGMLLIGAGLHILPRLARTELASEKNAALVSFLWTISVLVLVIGAHDSEVLGINIIFVGTVMHVVAFLAIITNQLLTVSKRQGPLAIPGWLELASSRSTLRGISMSLSAARPHSRIVAWPSPRKRPVTIKGLPTRRSARTWGKACSTCMVPQSVEMSVRAGWWMRS